MNELKALRKKPGGGGRPPTGVAPSKAELVKLYVKGGKSLREVAEATGASKDTVQRALKRYGIALRPAPRRAGLKDVNIKRLEADVKAQGLRATARTLGVDKRAVSYHLGKARKQRG